MAIGSNEASTFNLNPQTGQKGESSGTVLSQYVQSTILSYGIKENSLNSLPTKHAGATG